MSRDEVALVFRALAHIGEAVARLLKLGRGEEWYEDWTKTHIALLTKAEAIERKSSD